MVKTKNATIRVQGRKETVNRCGKYQSGAGMVEVKLSVSNLTIASAISLPNTRGDAMSTFTLNSDREERTQKGVFHKDLRDHRSFPTTKLSTCVEEPAVLLLRKT